MTRGNPAPRRGRLIRALLPFAGLALSFLVCGVMLLFFGIDPLKTYASIFTRAFGSANGIAQTVCSAIPMIIVAAGIDFAKKAGIFNIGAEGQMMMGALGAQLAAMQTQGLPPAAAVPATLAGGFVFGALWALLPGILKASLRVNEIVVTIMMNQIASYLLAYLVRSPLKDPKDFNSQSVVIPESARLPSLFSGSKIHMGLVVALLLILFLWLLSRRTSFGYRVEVVGASPKTAAYAGISVPRTVLAAFLLAGGIAGIAGANEVSGLQHRLTASISNGYGFVGLTVAMIADGNPIMIAIVSVLYSALQAGGLMIQITQHVPMELANIIQAVTVLFVLSSDAIYKGFAGRAPKKRAAAPAEEGA